jgi:hypothetical protein
MNTAIISRGKILFALANAKKNELRRAQIRAEVEARYDGILRSAGFWSRWIIRRKIRKEVSALLRAELPSRQALFSQR